MKVKVCRILDLPSAMMLVELGADYLGFHVLGDARPGWEREAAAINRSLLDAGFDGGVVLTRVDDEDWLRRLVAEGGYRFVQFHDYLRLERMAALADIVHHEGASLIQVVQPRRVSRDYIHAAGSISDYLLFDSSYRGGTGEQLTDEDLARLPLTRSFIAGGVDARRASELAELAPYAVDAQSRLEFPDKSKDPDRVRALIDAARGRHD